MSRKSATKLTQKLGNIYRKGRRGAQRRKTNVRFIAFRFQGF